MKNWKTGALVVATLTSGLTAGLFAGFAYSVMPGLKRSDDHAFVEVMRNINVVIVNPLFMTLFFGGLMSGVIAMLGLWPEVSARLRLWLVAGVASYVVMLGVTSGINVPLNDQLAVGDLNQIDLAAVRSDFEDTWVVWNIVRALANLVAFVSFTWALVLFSRSPQAAPAPRFIPTPVEPVRPGS
ncbi:anthrone oxygenase family protein [Nocardia jejuensis]|uniref:anthrone oxygenase family protein n=1 Tax=Nocardia jejuensis TaxID=328049 RepID=UPI00082BAB24|nr:anthrone oxygenase family protein [Nocardia jejuensis]